MPVAKPHQDGLAPNTGAGGGGVQAGSGGIPSTIAVGPLTPPADLGTISPGVRIGVEVVAGSEGNGGYFRLEFTGPDRDAWAVVSRGPQTELQDFDTPIGCADTPDVGFFVQENTIFGVELEISYVDAAQKSITITLFDSLGNEVDAWTTLATVEEPTIAAVDALSGLVGLWAPSTVAGGNQRYEDGEAVMTDIKTNTTTWPVQEDFIMREGFSATAGQGQTEGFVQYQQPGNAKSSGPFSIAVQSNRRRAGFNSNSGVDADYQYASLGGANGLIPTAALKTFVYVVYLDTTFTAVNSGGGVTINALQWFALLSSRTDPSSGADLNRNTINGLLSGVFYGTGTSDPGAVSIALRPFDASIAPPPLASGWYVVTVREDAAPSTTGIDMEITTLGGTLGDVFTWRDNPNGIPGGSRAPHLFWHPDGDNGGLLSNEMVDHDDMRITMLALASERASNAELQAIIDTFA